MIKYQLTVIAFENNENYEAEVAAEKERAIRYGYPRNYDMNDRVPQLVKANKCLEMTLTAEEYKKLKAEAFKAFE